MKKMLLSFVLSMVICVATSYSQTFTVKSFGVSPRTSEEDTIAHYFDRTFTGLQNVGNQTKVFLEVSNTAAKLNAPVWSFTSMPVGSAVTFGATNDLDTSHQVITFIPDMVGKYIINVTDGSSSASITINSGLYVGIQTGACYVCHNGAFVPAGVPLYTKWQGTGHATMLERGLNGTLSSHYSEACISCHTTGYDTLATNNGFDDYPFVFPDTLIPGMYDSMKAVYPQAMALANIQCESCHGPGGSHYGAPDVMTVTLSPDVCASCHDEGTHHFFPTQYNASVHANPTTLARGSSTSCAPCHSGSGFVSWIKAGKTALTTAPAVQKISCQVCHDPHDATNIYQLRTLTATLENGTTISNIGTGALCMNCHHARQEAVSYTDDYLNNLSHFGPHHGPQGDVIAGTNGVQFGWNFPSSPHMQAAEGCIACHMAAAGANADGSIQQFGSHSLNMVDPATGNDNVAACAPCHGTIGTSFSDKKFYVNGNADLDHDGTANGLQIEVQGMLDKIATYLPNTDGPDSTWTLLQAQAFYNWDMVEEDRSLGVHNPQYVYSLLAVTLQKLDPTTDIKLIDNTVPQSYALDQNFPNPFNPTTTIRFTLPKEGNVRIDVFDITGRLVTTLVNSNKAVGTYSVTWDGRNSNGQAVGSGIYLYRIHSNDFSSVKKMVMLK